MLLIGTAPPARKRDGNTQHAAQCVNGSYNRQQDHKMNIGSQLDRLWSTSHQTIVNNSTQSNSTMSRQLPW